MLLPFITNSKLPRYSSWTIKIKFSSFQDVLSTNTWFLQMLITSHNQEAWQGQYDQAEELEHSIWLKYRF